jgi:hypothetical protein
MRGIYFIVLLASFALAACGGPEPKDYLGVWAIAGTTTVAGTSGPASGEKAITQGLFRTVLLEFADECPIPLDVDLIEPSTAHLNVDLGRCVERPLVAGSDVTVAHNFNSADATLNDARNTIHLTGSATRTVDRRSNGTPVSHDVQPISFDWTLTKQ